MLCFSCSHACSYAVLWTPENLHAIVLTIQILASLKSHASASEWHTVATVPCFGDCALMFKSKFRKEKSNHTCCCSCNYIVQGSAYENASAVISRWTWQYCRSLNGASDGKSMALFKMIAILCCCPSGKTNPFPSVYV